MIDDFKRPGDTKFERKPARMDSFRDELPRPDTQTGADQDTNDTPAAEPEFQPPEHFSQSKDTNGHTEHLFLPPLEHVPEIAEHATKPKWRFWPPRKPNLTKKQWIIVGAALLLLIGGGAAFALTRDKPQPVVVKKAPVKVVPPPPPILSPLTGLVVTQEQKDRPVTGVMIENSPNSRPQSGLNEAGVVFEAIAEAGITRFLCLFQDSVPGNVGPVRSARPYYLDWAMAFDATYAHVGGSPDALQRIKEIGVKDLDQFFNSSAYRRDSKRFAPHNVYTDIVQLIGVGQSKGYTSSTFTPLLRKAKEEPSKTPNVNRIDIAISSGTYNVHYDYDPAKNVYMRSMGGAVHADAESGAQISPKVVVALAMPYSIMADGLHSQYQTTGSGQMIVFQDGVGSIGTWSKAAPKDQFVFKDSAGGDLKLNPGQTWFTVVSDLSRVTYAP